MRRPFVSLWAMVAVVGTSAVAGEVRVEYRRHDRWLLCARADKTLQINGALADWDVAHAPIRLSREAVRARGSYWPHIDSDADASSVCDVRWDDRYLYLMIHARDDKRVYGEQVPYNRHWNFDSMQVYLHPSGQGRGTGRYPAKFDAKHVFVLVPNGANMAFLPTGSRAGVREHAGGYDAEVAMAWQGLPARPRAGDRIKFTLLQVDADSTLGAGGQPEKLWGQMAWVWPAAGHNDPRWWVDLRLLDAHGVGGDLTVGRDTYRPSDRVRLKAQVDAAGPGWRVEALGVKDPAGRTVCEVPVRRALKPGHTLVLTGELPAARMGTGRRVASLVLAKGATRYDGPVQAGFTVVAGTAPTLEPAVEVPLDVDPSRYGSDGRRVRPARVVTRKDYREFVDFMRRREEPRIAAIDPTKPGRRAVFHASKPALWYRIWGDEKYAKMALNCFRADDLYLDTLPKKAGLGFTYLPAALQAYLWVKDSPSIKPADHAWVRRWLVRAATLQIKHAERGAMNRSLGTALGLSVLTLMYPDMPRQTIWRGYGDAVWHDWWDRRDTFENSVGYNALWLDYMLRYVDANGLDERGFFDDPKVRTFLERFMHQMSPMGAMPLYGDSTSWGLATGYMFVFERAATAYRDGRFKWAAHRMLEYLQQYYPHLLDWHLVPAHGAIHLGQAYLAADDRIPERVPQVESRVLYRKAAVPVPRSDWVRGPHMALLDDTIPDKVVLKSGYDPRDMYALVGACRPLGHNGDDTTTFHALVDHGSVLLMDQGYMQREAVHHNLVVVEDLEGLTPVDRPMRESVPEFVESPVATFATVQVENYFGWPVTLRRHIAFVKNHCVVVRDEVRFTKAFKCRVAPVWHTRRVGPKVGPNWANTYIDKMINKSIFHPTYYTEWRNPAYDLLVYFLARGDCRMSICEPEPGLHVPRRIRYQWTGLPAEGQVLTFTSVLVPHRPGPNPDRLAAGIRTLADTNDRVMLRVARPGCPDAWVVINVSGKPFEAGPIAGDCRFACILARDRAVVGHVAAKGRTLAFRGKALSVMR